MYSTTNHILSRVTEQEDSILNSIAAGTVTGAIFKSTGDLDVSIFKLLTIIVYPSPSWGSSCGNGWQCWCLCYWSHLIGTIFV